ncbi:hypothetical protein V8G54_001067 [Vigna mungo]|uniref:Uncharacterized protein n=1 Tax=Vigna mungo TaxID=3915 RepID=A0AAQ3P9U1_VIGMU
MRQRSLRRAARVGERRRWKFLPWWRVGCCKKKHWLMEDEGTAVSVILGMICRRKNEDRLVVLEWTNMQVRVCIFAFRDCGSLFAEVDESTREMGRSFMMVHQWRKLRVSRLMVVTIKQWRQDVDVAALCWSVMRRGLGSLGGATARLAVACGY